MRKRITTLLLTLVMVLSLLVPAYAAESDSTYASDITAVVEKSDSSVVTSSMLSQLYGLLELDYSGEATQQDVVVFLFRYAGMEDSQLSAVSYKDNAEQFEYDCNELAKSIGLLTGISYDADASCSVEQFSAMLKNVEVLYNALHADAMQPLFVNGMAQPIFPYTSGAVEEGYDNANSDIIRFCVYVETNYDTDGDGKLDLVKALVQLPRAAMEGDYKAATIYEARPYITGCTDRSLPLVEGGYDLEQMYSQPAARTANGTATTAEAAAAADSADWYYLNHFEDMYDYEDLTWYDYYLVRGFAVVECGGLGTKDSEGFETCGTDLEIDAFKCVIEWLHGDRVAYTDKTSNITIQADWSNGKVGMTGRSYAGTTQFGLATTGVAGLETIVPVAGIASWYEYTNSQGVSTRTDPNYSEWLAAYCTGRYLDAEDYATIENSYGRYMQQIKDLQLELNGDYGEHWAIRDYTVAPLMDDWTGIQIPALIVHGLNDTNVRTKEFDLMYDAFVKANQNVKLLLHQGTHLTPTYPAGGYEMYINGEYYDSILNKWFSHYLYGVNNGVEQMDNVTVQSNVDGSWETYSNWDTAYDYIRSCKNVTNDATSQVLGGERYRNENNEWVVTEDSVTATYSFAVPEDVTIQGPVAVHIRAAASAENLSTLDGVSMTVDLTDKSESEFNAFVPERSYLPYTTLREDGAWMGGGIENFNLVVYDQTATTSKSIGLGYIDLFNPTAGYDSASAAVRTELVDGQYYDYTVYIQPTFYTVKAGHTLELSISLAYNSGVTLTVDNTATYMELPVHSAVSAAAGVFADVTASNWCYEAVEYVYENNLMNGMTATTFEPGLATSRGMLVTILYRLEGSPEAETSSFTDVAEGSWYTDAVAWASANGIVTGYEDNSFRPTKAVTREEMAAILYRYAQYKSYDVSAKADLSAYTDADNIQSYAVEAMQWANAKELITGVTTTTLIPGGDSNRAVAATILMRFCENVVK